MNPKAYLGLSSGGFHRIAYSEWGQPNTTQSTVICVHGLTRNRHDFDPLASYLAQQGHHIFCPDIAGRGDSDWLKNPAHYNFLQYIADMNALIARTAAKQIDWIGTSMGGLIGMMIASQPNSPINRLVLNDIGPQIPISGLRRLAKYSSSSLIFANSEEAKKYYKTIYADFGRLSEPQWESLTNSSIHLQSPGVYVSKCDANITRSKTATTILFELIRQPRKALQGIFFDINLWSIWQNIKCPVLIIHGRHSDILLPEHIAKMQATHAHTTVIEIDDAGHAPALMETTEHKKIAEWLGSVQSNRLI